MAIYHLHVKVIGRSSGASAVAAAAYRSASRLRDKRIDRSHDFSAKRGVVHSEVLLPEGAPETWSDRERLWNAVEAFEVRKDAQLAREVEFAIPRELSEQQGIALARDFVEQEFVARGMIADLNVHWEKLEDATAKPHAHVMLTMRRVDETGFGAKVRDWNRTHMVELWRERWADLANERLAELDIDARIDHRSLEAQGIALEPQSQIGAPAQRIEGQGTDAARDVADRAALHREIARGNGERIIADPSLALDAITQQQSTFTVKDLARFAHRHSEGMEQFNEVMGVLQNAPELVELGRDGRGQKRFTTRAMIAAEERLHHAAVLLAGRQRQGVDERGRENALAQAKARGLVLSEEQTDALAHVTEDCGLSLVVGHAGTGKSAMLGVARQAWETAGYRVQGVAVSGIAAENLERGSGIASRTIASMEYGREQGRDALTSRDVLVIDEAGMVGTRQLEHVLSHAADAGAKVVLVGDARQLQAIEAGAAFRSLHERHGAAEIAAVRRQRQDWQRDATRDLATGRTGIALAAYDSNGMVHEAATRNDARDDLIERWNSDRQAAPDESRIILTHTNAEVRLLNEAARDRMRQAGALGDDVSLTVARGERRFAAGDRVMFLKNERGLGVKNGTLGTIEHVSTQAMAVRTDDGRSVCFDLKDYDHLDHGYAATIHKAQGMTVDRTHVLATPGLDAHSSYVALSRHRDGTDLHYARDDFADRQSLVRTLSRDRAKDMASDYDQGDPAQAFAERRGIAFRARVAELMRRIVPERLRETIDDMMDGLRQPDHAVPGRDVGAVPERDSALAAAPQSGSTPALGVPLQPERDSVAASMPHPDVARSDGVPLQPDREHAESEAQRQAESPALAKSAADDPEALLRRARTQALIRHARAVDAFLEEKRQGLVPSEDHWRDLSAARKAFDEVRPYGWQDAEAAYNKDNSLAGEAASGRVVRTIRALQLETEIRTDLQDRADRFVERFKSLDRAGERKYAAGDYDGYKAARREMSNMAMSLERDPQLESLLANRRQELGITFGHDRSLARTLAFNHGLDFGGGRGLGR